MTAVTVCSDFGVQENKIYHSFHFSPFYLPLSDGTRGFPGGSVIKNPPAMQETWVLSLCGEDPLEEGVVSHSSVLVWRTSWTEEPGRLQSIELQRIGDDRSDLA